jgi:hypothetical protein
MVGGLVLVETLAIFSSFGAFREGRTLAAATYALLAVVFAGYSLSRFLGRSTADKWLWVSDDANAGATVPRDCDGAGIMLASDITRIEVRYEYPPLNPREGWLEMLVFTRGESEPELINQRSIWGYRKFVRIANALANRWHVPLVVDRHSIQHAKWGRGKFEQFIALLLAGGVLAFGAYIAIRQWNLRDWPSVPATVVRFDLNERGGVNGFSWYANPSIEYRYLLNGQELTASGLNPSPFNYLDKDALQADTVDFREGQTIRCWYNAQNPLDAFVVNVGVTTDTMVVIGSGVALLVVFFTIHRRMAGIARIETLFQSGTGGANFG